MHPNFALLFCLFSICISCFNAKAQEVDLKDYEWKNRIIFLISEEKGQVCQEQLNVLLSDANELIDRKLIIFQIEPNRYRLINPIQDKYDKWIDSDGLYKSYGNISSPFEIQLIGLDGGIKMRSDEMVSPDDLFSLIDGMPMRQIELRNRNQ